MTGRFLHFTSCLALHITTLQRMIAGIGRKLKLVAEFSDEEIVINQFEMAADSVPQTG
ncbi:MAG: hypothetical protein U0175_03455 [Caldilineaceae bacterium]